MMHYLRMWLELLIDMPNLLLSLLLSELELEMYPPPHTVLGNRKRPMSVILEIDGKFTKIIISSLIMLVIV
jgi:hypothetical protein